MNMNMNMNMNKRNASYLCVPTITKTGKIHGDTARTAKSVTSSSKLERGRPSRRFLDLAAAIGISGAALTLNLVATPLQAKPLQFQVFYVLSFLEKNPQSVEVVTMKSLLDPLQVETFDKQTLRGLLFRMCNGSLSVECIGKLSGTELHLFPHIANQDSAHRNKMPNLVNAIALLNKANTLRLTEYFTVQIPPDLTAEAKNSQEFIDCGNSSDPDHDLKTIAALETLAGQYNEIRKGLVKDGVFYMGWVQPSVIESPDLQKLSGQTRANYIDAVTTWLRKYSQ